MVGEKRGYESFCEHVVPHTNNHAVDAAWKIGDHWHVFEVVVTSEDNLASHLESVFLTPGSAVERATIVAPQKGMLAGLKAQVDKCQSLAPFAERVSYSSIEEFEKELWP